MSGTRPRSGLLSRLVEMIRRPEAPAPAGAAAPPSQPNQLTDENFQLSIKEMLEEDAGRFQAKLQIVSLVEFREAVGDKWPVIADKVMMIAEGVIQLHMGPGNTFGRQGDDVFVLLFRNCAHTEARWRALEIAKDLGTRLVGDKVLGADRPLALAAEVHLAGAANPDGSLNPRVVAQAVNEMRALVAIAEQAGGDDHLRSWMKQRLESPKPPPPLRAHLRPSKPMPPAGKAAKAARKLPAAPTGMIDFNEQLRRLAPRWKTINPHGPDGLDDLIDGPRPLPPDTTLSLLWRPTWTDDEAIGTYRALIQRRSDPDQPCLEGTAAYTGGQATAQTLDAYVIATAMRSFRAAEKVGLDSSIVLPIHWATLYSVQRMELLAPMAEVTVAARAARLVIELFGIPDDVEPDDLEAATGVLRATCREVIWRTSLSDPRSELAARCGASCIAVDLSDLPEAERGNDSALMGRLDSYREDATRAEIGACVWGVRRRPVITGTVTSGFAMVNGPALMKDIAKPAKVVPAPVDRFATTL